MTGEVFFIGRLVQDPINHQRNDGKDVTFLRVVVNYFGNENGNFFNLAVHGNAQTVAKKLKVGELVGVQAFATENTREYDAVWTKGRGEGRPVRLSQVVFQVRRLYFGGMNLNQWVGSGRLTHDPQLRYLSDGKAVVNTRIAVDAIGQRDETTFVDITVWGKLAESLAQHKAKGDPVAVIGPLLIQDSNPIASEDLQAIKNLVNDPASGDQLDKSTLTQYIDMLYKRRRDVRVVASQVIWLPGRQRSEGEASHDELPDIPTDVEPPALQKEVPPSPDEGSVDENDFPEIPDPTEYNEPGDDLPEWDSVFPDED